ncbi:DinB family protein [Nesterenkonia sp. Act20]|uniref:mycothiol transferase n=1 Tax=Nesterenkonia sp. Act20 TaxID=1483432 RepID=UPI001C46DE95|nr:DinB family protein [Nesterenkonia sp. Act20]
MSSVEILKDVARRPRDEAQALRSALSPTLLNAHPHHDNSIAWLLWHAAREIDEQIATLSGSETVWTAQGFDARFNLGLSEHDMGFGHSPKQARQIRVQDADLLLEHLDAVVQAQLTYLDSLSEADLEEVIDEQWDPPVTRSARLVSVSLDAVAHVNQAAYITGMGADAFDADHADQPR